MPATIGVASVEEAIRFVNARPKPLALYLFSRDHRVQARVAAETSSGGLCLNDLILHLTVPDLPFGGVGASGFGRYHGRAGFECFSNMKSVLHHRGHDLPIRFPPSSPARFAWLRRLFRLWW